MYKVEYLSDMNWVVYAICTSLIEATRLSWIIKRDGYEVRWEKSNA